jgi:hypothetical protein
VSSSAARSKLLVWAVVSAAAMAVGALAPWAEVFVVSISGMQEGNKGWLVLAAAAGGALAAYWAWTRATLVGGAGAVGCGALGAIVTLVERGNVRELGFGPFGAADVGWGLTLAMLASFSLVLAGVALVVVGMRERRQVELAALPAGTERLALGPGAIPMPAAPERALPPGDRPEGTPAG